MTADLEMIKTKNLQRKLLKKIKEIGLTRGTKLKLVDYY